MAALLRTRRPVERARPLHDHLRLPRALPRGGARDALADPRGRAVVARRDAGARLLRGAQLGSPADRPPRGGRARAVAGAPCGDRGARRARDLREALPGHARAAGRGAPPRGLAAHPRAAARGRARGRAPRREPALRPRELRQLELVLPLQRRPGGGELDLGRARRPRGAAPRGALGRAGRDRRGARRARHRERGAARRGRAARRPARDRALPPRVDRDEQDLEPAVRALRVPGRGARRRAAPAVPRPLRRLGARLPPRVRGAGPRAGSPRSGTGSGTRRTSSARSCGSCSPPGSPASSGARAGARSLDAVSSPWTR